MYIYICTYIYIYIHPYICIYIHITYSYIYIFAHTYIRIDMSGVGGNDTDIPNARTGDSISMRNSVIWLFSCRGRCTKWP